MTMQGEELEKALAHDEALRDVFAPGPYSDTKSVSLHERVMSDAMEKLSALLMAKCIEAISQATPGNLELAVSNVQKMLSLRESLKSNQ
jgi:hypothetical protein